MIDKKKTKDFNSIGFTVIKKLLSKKEIDKVFSQMNSVLNTILKFNKIKYKKGMSIKKKYFLLKKKKPILKTHFYDCIRIMDSFNNIVNSKKVTKVMKKLLNTNTLFITNNRMKTDHRLEPNNIALHQELFNISTDSAILFCPFVKMNKNTGGIMAIPGSHKYGHLKFKGSKTGKRSKVSPKNLPSSQIGVVEKILNNEEKIDYKNPIVNKLFKKENFIFPTLNPGDALIFKTMTFHGSTPYKGKNLRWVLTANYHRPYKTPYLLQENFIGDKNTLESNRPMRIPYKVNLDKVFN